MHPYAHIHLRVYIHMLIHPAQCSAFRCLRVLEQFPLGAIHPSQLRQMLNTAYSTQAFAPSTTAAAAAATSNHVMPTSQLGQAAHRMFLMEMYRGPTGN